MQRGYSFDLVYNNFIPNPDWQEKLPSFEEIYGEKVRHFRDIFPGCYRIKGSTNHGVDEYGATLYVLTVEDRIGDVFHVWAPSSLADCLKLCSSASYVWKHGLIREGKGRTFHGFSIS